MRVETILRHSIALERDGWSLANRTPGAFAALEEFALGAPMCSELRSWQNAPGPKMPTLLNSTDREAILQRLRRLQPSSQPNWGTFTAPKMVCHLADSLRVSLGDLQAKHVDTFLSRTLIKWLVVYSPMPPPPGKIQTSPEMLTSAPTTWAEDLATVETLIGRMAATPVASTHPFFGPLDHGGWGRLTWKHLDHHLRQFSC